MSTIRTALAARTGKPRNHQGNQLERERLFLYIAMQILELELEYLYDFVQAFIMA